MKLAAVEFRPAIGGAHPARAEALKVGNIKRISPRVVNDGAGEPADGNEAKQPGFAGIEFKNGDGILGAVADKELAARLIEGQCVGLGAE